MTNDPRSPSPTSADERSRIDRFEAAYNRIDRELQRILDEPREGRRRGFASSLRQIASQRRHFGRHLDFLLEAGELRNALVHNRLGTVEYIAVPTNSTVEQIEAIDEELRKPLPLRSISATDVVMVSVDDRVGRVLALVREKGFVRFPVRRDNRIIALLTASGVVRWIASHDIDACALPTRTPAPARTPTSKPTPTAKDHPRADAGALDQTLRLSDGERIICTIASVTVGEVLARDHRKDEFAIVPRDSSVEDALALWTRNPRLEAVIITERGKPEETPLGIATATDLIKMLERRS
ncbi:MAG: CBS domain-containing protein [Planctomycetota bacterium]|nr:MAG: CBS domain-containing protein [Planctomycetota bacterium]